MLSRRPEIRVKDPCNIFIRQSSCGTSGAYSGSSGKGPDASRSRMVQEAVQGVGTNPFGSGNRPPKIFFRVTRGKERWKGQEKYIPAKTGSYAIQARLFVRDKYIYQAQRIYSHACTVKALERNSKIRDFIDASRDHSTTKRNIFPRFSRSVDRIPPAHGRVPPKTPQNRGVFVRDN